MKQRSSCQHLSSASHLQSSRERRNHAEESRNEKQPPSRQLDAPHSSLWLAPGCGTALSFRLPAGPNPSVSAYTAMREYCPLGSHPGFSPSDTIFEDPLHVHKCNFTAGLLFPASRGQSHRPAYILLFLPSSHSCPVGFSEPHQVGGQEL